MYKSFTEFVQLEDTSFHSLMARNKKTNRQKIVDFDDSSTGSTVRLVDIGTHFLLTGLETPPENRGKGGAKRVMQRAIQYAIDNEKNIELSVIPDDDTDTETLIKLYSSFGFRKTGQPYNHMRYVV